MIDLAITLRMDKYDKYKERFDKYKERYNILKLNVPAVMGRLGSSLGRFLYLTRADTGTFLGLDTNKFSVL